MSVPFASIPRISGFFGWMESSQYQDALIKCSRWCLYVFQGGALLKQFKAWVRNVKWKYGWTATCISLVISLELFPDYKTQHPALP